MTKIESDIVQIEVNTENVFAFLSNLNNYEKLMPAQVSEWWSIENEAKMKIQGLGKLYLKKDETLANSYIKIIPAETPPVHLFLEWFIDNADNGCKVKLIINADLNMMMQMLASKPLQNLANYMVAQINKGLT